MAIFALEKHEMGQLFDTLLHTGIHTYKKKHSKASLPARVEAEKRSKRHAKAQFLWCVKSRLYSEWRERVHRDVEGNVIRGRAFANTFYAERVPYVWLYG